MSRLDRHVSSVRNRMALGTLLWGWAWAGLALSAAVWVAILVHKLFQVELPRQMVWFYAGLGAAVVSIYRRAA